MLPALPLLQPKISLMLTMSQHLQNICCTALMTTAKREERQVIVACLRICAGQSAPQTLAMMLRTFQQTSSEMHPPLLLRGVTLTVTMALLTSKFRRFGEKKWIPRRRQCAKAAKCVVASLDVAVLALKICNPCQMAAFDTARLVRYIRFGSLMTRISSTTLVESFSTILMAFS